MQLRTDLEPIAMDPIVRLNKDLRKAATTLGLREAGYLVKLYYTVQENRKAAASQGREMSASDPDQPHELISWAALNFEVFEYNIRNALACFSGSHPVGQWAESIHGIGPVISAGLLASIDMNIAVNPAKIFRFAGLDPTSVWKKGEKRPWNADLKVLCWKIGDSFMKQSGSEKCHYGRLYLKRKDLEWERNLNGECADAARLTLETKNFDKASMARFFMEGKADPVLVRKLMLEGAPTIEWDAKLRERYNEGGRIFHGMIPPGRVVLRAQRYAVKRFLSHWWAVAFEVHYGKKAPLPWAIEHGWHGVESFEPPPNWPMMK